MVQYALQHLIYAILGYATDPSINTNPDVPRFLGTVNAVQATELGTVDVMRTTNAQKKELKRTEKSKGDMDVIEGVGAYVDPWGT
jgi:pre-mRNA-processing factor 17